MNLIVEKLPESLRVSAKLAAFDFVITETTRKNVHERGLGGAAGVATACLGWIWQQWLAAAQPSDIHSQARPLVDRGMQMQSMASTLEWRGRHDLFLLHCAIFVSEEAQLMALAEKVVDASGFGGQAPEQRFGELYACAWSGMLKYWILGDLKKAFEQAEIAWTAYEDDSFRAASKKLVKPWLENDWRAFAKAQSKDFERLWARARKGDAVLSEKGDDVVVSTWDISIPQTWCWAHCGLALLAYRRMGVEVVTDPLWFPTHALKVVPK